MDGYLADKSHTLDWLYQTGMLEETGYNDFYKNMDITIMGKRTFAEIEITDNAASLCPTIGNYVSRILLHYPKKDLFQSKQML